MKNFCVIDIGTNAVKIKIFSDGRYVSLRNKLIGQVNNNVSNYNDFGWPKRRYRSRELQISRVPKIFNQFCGLLNMVVLNKNGVLSTVF